MCFSIIPSFRPQELGVAVTHSNIEVVGGSDVVFVAVKPHLIPLVLNEISQHVTDRHTIVSVAAGVTLATLEEVSASVLNTEVGSAAATRPLNPCSVLSMCEAPSREFGRHPADAKSAVHGSGRSSSVCTGNTCKAGGWSPASLLVASLWFGGGGTRDLDRHPYRTERERSGFCE